MILRFAQNDRLLKCLCSVFGVGWRLRRQPTPSHYKDIVMICHSERSEESNIFYQTTIFFFKVHDFKSYVH